MATTTNYGWTTPDDTDLVKDGAAAIRTLGSSIDTSFVADQGDLLLGGASDIFEPLAIGAADTVLTSDGTTASWAAPAGGGTVVKVQSTAVTSTFTTSSTTFVDITSYSVSITPTAATSKVLILASFTLNNPGGVADKSEVRLLRGATAIVDPITRANDNNNTVLESGSISYLDSPATTSATTYKIQLKTSNASEPARIGSDYSGSPVYVYTITAIEIGA